MKGNILEINDSTVEGQQVLDAIGRLVRTTDGSMFFGWLAQEHMRISLENTAATNEIGFRWNQGAAQAIEDIGKFSREGGF